MRASNRASDGSASLQRLVHSHPRGCTGWRTGTPASVVGGCPVLVLASGPEPGKYPRWWLPCSRRIARPALAGQLRRRLPQPHTRRMPPGETRVSFAQKRSHLRGGGFTRNSLHVPCAHFISTADRLCSPGSPDFIVREGIEAFHETISQQRRAPPLATHISVSFSTGMDMT